MHAEKLNTGSMSSKQMGHCIASGSALRVKLGAARAAADMLVLDRDVRFPMHVLC